MKHDSTGRNRTTAARAANAGSACFYSDLALIESGQGAAVLRRVRPRWQAHVGRVFEDLARAHARRLVARGRWPDDLVVGRWWATTGEPCEVDVLGLRGGRAAVVGEARWQPQPLGLRELEALRRKAVLIYRLSLREKLAAADADIHEGRAFDAPEIRRQVEVWLRTRWNGPNLMSCRELQGHWMIVPAIGTIGWRRQWSVSGEQHTESAVKGGYCESSVR